MQVENSILKNSDSTFTILYYENVDIDGFKARDDILAIIKKHGRKKIYDRAHEWCCGHGAIGLKLLEQGLCRHLVLTDKFEPAIQGCNFTVALNELQDQVTTYLEEDLGNLPKTESWDLFVANPPWRSEITEEWFPRSQKELRQKYDVGWKIHNNMWNHLDKYLPSNAEIFLFEDLRFSDSSTWDDTVKRLNLQVIDCYTDSMSEFPTGYVLHLQKY